MYLKQRIAAGECLIGAGIYSYSPEVVEYSAAGMDWIWWEAQHSLVDWQTTVNGVRAAHIVQVPVLIRTWTHHGETIERLLDTAADGIIVPTVDRPEQAAEIVSHCYFPPAGNRSWGSARMERMERDTNEWNKRTVVIMMIETPEAVHNAEAIARVPGVDGLLIGPADLALRLGKPGAPFVPYSALQAEADQVLEACRNAGKAAAAIAGTPAEVAARIQEGFRLISAGMDVVHAAAAFRQLREAGRQAAAEANAPRWSATSGPTAASHGLAASKGTGGLC